ncbi:MAG: hypothetical protein PVJ39_04545 [Gammaproteobacteria bacterium]|jgi:hypothetical protein
MQLQAQLERAVRRLNDAIDAGVKSTVNAGWSAYARIETEYVVESAIKANVLSAIGGATRIRNFYTGLSDTVITNMVSRIYQDGYMYSGRVWRAASDYQTQINRVLSTGISLNRDVIEIARDIEQYTRYGKDSLMQRYGELEHGTKRFTRRIRRRVDYRALRLVRSELAASLQDAALIAGQNNPASNGLYEWIRVNVQEWGCDCPDNAANSPYTLENVPDYPHANCHPAGTNVLTNSGYISIESIVPGDLVVSADGNMKPITHAWKQVYSGDVVEIKTEDGVIVATPEHPLRSSDDWVLAHTLEPGDNLRCVRPNVETFPSIEPKPNNSPSKTFEKRGFFNVYSLLLGGGVPVTAIDFDGELYVREGEVDIVSTDSQVWERLLSSGGKLFKENPFVWAPDGPGIELSYLGLVFKRIGYTPLSIMCGSSITLPAVCNASIGALGNCGNFKPDVSEVPTNTASRDAEVFSYLVHGKVSVNKKPSQFVDRKFYFSTHDSAIVSVEKKRVNTVVYNLTVANDHSYIANGFMSHNCECQIRPLLIDNKVFVDDLIRWDQGEDVGYINAWVDRVRA